MPGLTASKEVQQSVQYTAVNDYLTGKTTSVEDTLEQLCEPAEKECESATKYGDIENKLSTSWKSIISLAAETPFTDPGMQKLVDLVVELKSRPDLERGGEKCVVQDMTVWKDLPTFGWQLRDAWNFAATDKDDEKSQQQWINLNAWTASLIAATRPNTNDNLDFSLYCIWTVRAALEEAATPSNTSLAAAATWFIFAAAAIRDLSTEEKTFQAKIAAPGPAAKDEEWRGFTESRWQIWTQKLSEVQKHVSDKYTSQLVQQARDAIAKVERKK